jgi:hypothetical protein
MRPGCRSTLIRQGRFGPGRSPASCAGARETRQQLEVAAEDIEQPGERELGLGFDRPRGQNGVAASFGPGADLAPDRGLADARLTFDEQDGRSLDQGLEEPIPRRELPVPADHATAACGH